VSSEAPPLKRDGHRLVERMAATVARRVLVTLRARGVLEQRTAPEEAFELLQLQGVQVPPSRTARPRRPARRCAVVEGFLLHANTWLHENDVLGLERLCSYGARGPLCLERLSELPDGRLAYRMKRPSLSGQTHLVLSPLAFLRRLAALVPPPRANLVRYFGVFAPNARLRPTLVPAAPSALLSTSTDDAPPPPSSRRRSRRPIPWAELLRRTFGADVLHCPRCAGPPAPRRRRPPLLHRQGHPRPPEASLPAPPPRPGHLPAAAHLLVRTLRNSRPELTCR
jgi:hypothetical protein